MSTARRRGPGPSSEAPPVRVRNPDLESFGDRGAEGREEDHDPGPTRVVVAGQTEAEAQAHLKRLFLAEEAFRPIDLPDDDRHVRRPHAAGNPEAFSEPLHPRDRLEQLGRPVIAVVKADLRILLGIVLPYLDRADMDMIDAQGVVPLPLALL